MVTPPKGDFTSVPLNAAGINAVNQWDPAKDIASGEQCRVFGAGGIMRMPVRLPITWQDATTLKIEIDNGNQTQLYFDPATQAPAKPDWQGFRSPRGSYSDLDRVSRLRRPAVETAPVRAAALLWLAEPMVDAEAVARDGGLRVPSSAAPS